MPAFFFFKSVQIYMKDAEYAESKEKSNFRFFIFLVMVIFVLKCPQFSMSFHDNMKNKNRKNDLSFVSENCATQIGHF